MSVECGQGYCAVDLMLVPFHRWTKAHELLIQQAIKKDHLATMVKESDAMLRWEDVPKKS